MTKLEKAVAYLKKNPTATVGQVRTALDCSSQPVIQARRELGLSLQRAVPVTDDLIDQLVAYQRANPAASRSDLMKAFNAPHSAVDRARQKMKFKRQLLCETPEYKAAVKYVESAKRRVKAKEIKEKFGLTLNASREISGMQEGYEMPTRNKSLPLTETDFGPNWDPRRFDALRVPWNRVAEVLGATA